MSKKSGRGVLVLIALVLLGICGAWAFQVHRHGQANLRQCPSIKPGGAREAILEAFGTPTGHSMNPAGTRLVLLFTSPLFAPHTIRAVVNVRDDLVVEIDCGDGRIRTFDQY